MPPELSPHFEDHLKPSDGGHNLEDAGRALLKMLYQESHVQPDMDPMNKELIKAGLLPNLQLFDPGRSGAGQDAVPTAADAMRGIAFDILNQINPLRLEAQAWKGWDMPPEDPPPPPPDVPPPPVPADQPW